MQNTETCDLLGLAADDLPIIRLHGQEFAVDLQGIDIIQSSSTLYRQVFEHRLRRIRRPLLCRVVARLSPSKIRAQLFYFAWQDKSGDVWLDVAQILLEEGLAKVAAYEFPERNEYLQWERGDHPVEN